ncbi:MAG: 3-dehydroquinate synthase [Pirellulales bacterium]|nr:3-dehydroquinate synthase [Pirellulales bacterium]
MATATTVQVRLARRGYDIQIGTGLLCGVDAFVRHCRPAMHVVVVTDSNVEALYADPIAERLSEQELDVNILTIEPGEPSKSPEVAAELWQVMLDAATDRQSLVLAVGGGVVGDLAGFVASTFARGLDLIQVPTTLLAQVDSSVGGKTGVNLPEAKNIVGTFWQPLGVLIDVDVLATLPEREYIAGLAEVVKYGVILDKEFFEFLEQNTDAILARAPETLIHIIARSCQLKADIVETDEREESGRRAVLNYGHTFGHALEAATGYERLLHGEGVAIGMQCAARLAARLGRIDAAVVDRQARLLRRLKLPTDLPEVNPNDVLHLMRRDKKVAEGQMRFVLPSRLGDVDLVGHVPTDAILASMNA